MHKKIFGALAISLFLAGGAAAGLSAADFSMVKADTDATISLELTSPYTSAAGFYVSVADNKGLPYSGDWDYRVFTSTASCVTFDGEDSKTGIGLVLYSANTWYVALGDAGVQRTAGEKSVVHLSGVWSGSIGEEIYNITLEAFEVVWSGAAWIEYDLDDDRLEAYDEISLLSVAAPDFNNEIIDTEDIAGWGNNRASVNAYAESAENTTRSFLFSFGYHYSGPNVNVVPHDRTDNEALQFRFGSSAAWVTGHTFKISILTRWGNGDYGDPTTGVLLFEEQVEGNNVNSSGDIIIHSNDGELHHYSAGIIKVKDSNKYYRYVAEDGCAIFGKTFTLGSDIERTTRVGIYYALADVKLTNWNVSEMAGTQAFTFVPADSTVNGLYFRSVDEIPFDTSWTECRGTPAKPENFTFNGEPLKTPGQKTAAGVVIKHDVNKYYFAISDCGKSASEGDVVHIGGEFHFRGAENRHIVGYTEEDEPQPIYGYDNYKMYAISIKSTDLKYTNGGWIELTPDGSLLPGSIEDLTEDDPIRNVGLYRPDGTKHAVKNFDQTPETLEYRKEYTTGKTGLFFTSSANAKSEVRFYLPGNAYKAEPKGYAFRSVTFDYRVMKTNSSIGTENGASLTENGEWSSYTSSGTTSFMIQLMNRDAKNYFCFEAPLINDGHLHTFTLSLNYSDIVGFNMCLFGFEGTFFISNIVWDVLPYDEGLNSFVVDSLKMFFYESHSQNWSEQLPVAEEAYAALTAEEKALFNSDAAYGSARNRLTTWRGSYKSVKAAELQAQYDALDLSAYRPADQEYLLSVLNQGLSAINNSPDKTSVDEMFDNYSSVIASVKTDAEKTAEELAAYKVAKKAELDERESALLPLYRAAEQELIRNGVSQGKQAIDAASDIAGVDAVVAGLEAQLAQLKTAAQYDAEESQAVIDMIDAIPNLTINNYEANEHLVTEARAAYEALTEEGKNLVGSKLALLEGAENRLAEIKAGKVEAEAMDARILAIGEVTLDKEATINQIRLDYEGMSYYGHALVSQVAVLEAAEARIAELKVERANADEVNSLIGAIGGVDASKACLDKITAARTAYNALNSEERDMVGSYAQVLIDAETAFRTALSSEKATAKANLDTRESALLPLYRAAEQELIRNGVAQGKAAIDSATCKEDIAAIIAGLEAQLAELKTAAEYDAEELLAAKTAAKAELEGYKNSSDYRSAEQGQLATIVRDGKSAIDAAESIDAVNAALANAKSQADALKTAAQYDAEELAAAKVAAKADLEETFASYDQSKYSKKGVEELEAAKAEGLSAIDSASSIEAVNAALASAKEAMAAVKVKKSGCGGSILATSAIITLIAAAGAALVFARKKED